MTVSRTHASVEPVDSVYEILDEASFNGVWVNNNSIDTYPWLTATSCKSALPCLRTKKNNAAGVRG